MNDRISPLSPEVQLVIDKCRREGLLKEQFIENLLNRANAELPLKIGIIGKMKAGKSTLINALIFQDYVLPSDVQPLTAVLTQISYNEEDGTSVKVDFFTEKDIKDLEASKEETIQKQLQKIYKIPNWQSLLGTTEKDVNIEELAEYTVADGKYSPITKQVNIKYHHESLQGICIVDTPGFNDPVTSRVEATKFAISSCQVLLFAHDTTSHYDKVEKEMLLSQIGYSQTAKIIDIVTKIDCKKVEEWDNIVDYVSHAKANLITELGENHYIALLLKDSPTIYVSGLMALIGHKKRRNESLSKEERLAESDMSINTGVISDTDYIETSNIITLCELINELSNQKASFLASSFPNELRGELLKTIVHYQGQIEADTSLKKLLSDTVGQITEQVRKVESIEEGLLLLFKTNSLFPQLCDSIDNLGNDMIQKRDTASNQEFTSSNYRQSYIVTNGGQDNYSQYTSFVRHFTADLRESLISFKGVFRNKIRSYVREALEQTLLQLHIDVSEVRYYTESIINYSDQLTSEINTDVPSYTLSKRLKGNPQHVYYSNDFLNKFCDSYIKGFLDSFKTAAKSFIWQDGEMSGFKNTVVTTTLELTTKLKKSIADPSEKVRLMEETETRISENKAKIASIETILQENFTIFNV